ncbi:hypothetical protein JM946_21810 [Steroidobacter sp. S1-65]|uniref:Right-handed parallel beta-helix repeat-containing protein n=1 Tax=Steroidobacter gossypii TaxID=2805490 RepID=A0ABS1X2E2_9GAMM|nr:hypothetical protein [Steroidobacter gossypii]MBM0107384.1 hypothetical protein [Steroidobacter gossypii]
MSLFNPTKWVDGSATGTGDGSQTNPWTMAQALASANPGDVIQLNAGTIVGAATGNRMDASFQINRPGTPCAPILWVAENYAAVNSTNRTTFTHPGTVPGNPVIGLYAPYNYLYGIHVYEPDAVPGEDSGAIIISQPHVKLCYCHLDRGQAQWSEYTNPTRPNAAVPTNMAGVFIEPGQADDLFDVQIADNLFTNYTAPSDVGYGCKAINLFSNPTRFCHNITFENNTFDNVNVAVYIKGSNPLRPVKGGLIFRRNLSRVSAIGQSPDLFHYNLSDTAETYGPNVFVQNLAYGGHSFVRTTHTGIGPVKGVYLVNNTALNIVSETNEDGFLYAYASGNLDVATWRIHNNILHTGPKFYVFPYSGGDRSVQSRDHNTAYQLDVSYSDVGDATPTIGRETLSELQERTGRDLSSAIRDPLLVSTTWGSPDFGKLQITSNERNAGIDVLDLQNGGTEASINRGCFITADMSDQIGVRALPTGVQTSQAAGLFETISVPHVAVGANRHVLIGVKNDGTVPASITYGSQTPTLLRSEGSLHLYSLLNPPTGQQTVSVTSATGIVNQALLVVSRPGVVGVGTAVSGNSNEQTTVSVNVPSAIGELVVDFAMMINTEIQPATGQTVRILMSDYDVMGFVAVGISERPGASSVTMQWQAAETFGDNAIIAVPLILAP